MDIKESLIELIDLLNSNHLPIDNTEIDFSFCLPLILNQFPNNCESAPNTPDEGFKLDNNNVELIGWNIQSPIYILLYNLNLIEYYDYLVETEKKLESEDLTSYWEKLTGIESIINKGKYEELIKLLIDIIHLIPAGTPSSIIDDNPSIAQNIDLLRNILNSNDTAKLIGLLLSLIYLQLGMTSPKFSLDHFISIFNLIQLNSTSIIIFLCNTVSEWSEFISTTVKYGIDSCFNPQFTQYAVKVLATSLKLQPHRKIEFLRLVKSTPFMSDEVLRLPNDNPSQIADYWNALFIDPQSLVNSISPTNNIPPNPNGWNLLFWENFAPTASSNSSINLMKIDSLLRCTLAYQKHVGGLFAEPFNAHTKILANIYKALAPSSCPERVYCSTLAFLLVNLNFRFPNQNQYVRHLLEKFWQIFPYGVAYLLGMIFRLPDSWEQLKKDLDGWMGVEYLLNTMDPHQFNAVKDYFSSEGIYPKRAKEILLTLPYTYSQPKEDRILVFGQPTDYCLESMILLLVNCKEYLACDRWILNMATQIPKFPIPPHSFKLIEVYIQRVVNKLSPKISEESIKLHLSDCYPYKPILPKHILLSYYYIKYYNCLVHDIANLNPNITELSYSHQIFDNIPLTEISKVFQSQSKFGIDTYYFNFKGLLAQFFKYITYSQNPFNRNFELNSSYRKPIGIYPIEGEVVLNSKSTYSSLIVQDLLKSSDKAMILYEFLLNTPNENQLFKFAKSVIEFGIKDSLTKNNSQLEYKFVQVWKRLHSKIPNLVWSYTLQGCSLVQLDTTHQLNNLINLESLMTDVMMCFRLPIKIYQSRYLIQIPLTMALCSLLGWKEKLLYGYLIKPNEFKNGVGFDAFNSTIVSEYTWLLQTLIELMNHKNYTILPINFDSIKLEIMKACDTLLLESSNLVKSLLHQAFDIDMIPQVLNNLPAAKSAVNGSNFAFTTLQSLMQGNECQQWFGICLTGHIFKLVDFEKREQIWNIKFIEKVKKVTRQYFERLPLHNSTLKQYITPNQVKDALLLMGKNHPPCDMDMNSLINTIPFESVIDESNKTSLADQSQYDYKFQYFHNNLELALISSPTTTSPSNRAARPITPPNAYHQPPNRGGGEFSNESHHFSKRGSVSIDYDGQPLTKGNHKKFKKDGVDANSYRPPTSTNYTKPQRANSSNPPNPRGNKSPNSLPSNNVRPNAPQYHGQHSQSQAFRESGGGGRFQPSGNRPHPGRNSGGHAAGNRDNEERFGHPNPRPRGKSFPRGGGNGGPAKAKRQFQ